MLANIIAMLQLLVMLGFFALIYLFYSSIITVFRGKMYGLEIIVWEFGAGKSFYTHRDITGPRMRKVIRIGNYASPDFHLQFRSMDDLLFILTAVVDYKKDPANLKQSIVLVIDEAALYFNSRDFKKFPIQVLALLVQLRKLNVNTKLLAQDLKMVDINFRRLCYNVRKYYKGLHFLRWYRDYELLSEDANLNDPINTIASKPYLLLWPTPLLWLFGLSSRFFGSSRYDTNELILPQFSVSSQDKILSVFPSTVQITDSQMYIDTVEARERALAAKTGFSLFGFLNRFL